MSPYCSALPLSVIPLAMALDVWLNLLDKRSALGDIANVTTGRLILKGLRWLSNGLFHV